MITGTDIGECRFLFSRVFARSLYFRADLYFSSDSASPSTGLPFRGVWETGQDGSGEEVRGGHLFRLAKLEAGRGFESGETQGECWVSHPVVARC